MPDQLPKQLSVDRKGLPQGNPFSERDNLKYYEQLTYRVSQKVRGKFSPQVMMDQGIDPRFINKHWKKFEGAWNAGANPKPLPRQKPQESSMPGLGFNNRRRVGEMGARGLGFAGSQVTTGGDMMMDDGVYRPERDGMPFERQPYSGRGGAFRQMGGRRQMTRDEYSDSDAGIDERFGPGSSDRPATDDAGAYDTSRQMQEREGMNEGGSDGLTDAMRAFRDEVEGGTEENELYEGLDGWQERWLKRAKEMGLGFEEAMRVLDSIADLDPPEEGYGEEAWPEGGY